MDDTESQTSSVSPTPRQFRAKAAKIDEEKPAQVLKFKPTTAEDRGSPTGNPHGEWAPIGKIKGDGAASTCGNRHIYQALSTLRTDTDPTKPAVSSPKKKNAEEDKEFWNMRRASARAMPIGNPKGEWKFDNKVRYEASGYPTSSLRSDTDPKKSAVTVGKSASTPQIDRARGASIRHDHIVQHCGKEKNWNRIPLVRSPAHDKGELPEGIGNAKASISTLRADSDPKKDVVSTAGKKTDNLKKEEEFWNMRRASARAMPTGNVRGEWKIENKVTHPIHEHTTVSSLRADTDPKKSAVTIPKSAYKQPET